MDLWVVAAAAGAGYIAKNLQNLSLDKKESSGVESSSNYSIKVQTESRNFLQQLRDKTCPLRKLARKRAQNDTFLEAENHSDVNSSDIDWLRNKDSEAGVASSSIYDALGKHDNLGWISSLPSVLKTEESLEFEDGQNRKGKFSRSRKLREHSVIPLNSLGSCLDAQLCKEHEKMEETMSSSVPLILTVRPVLVTEGNRTISRSSSDATFIQFEGCREKVRRENGVCFEENGSVLRSASFEQTEIVEQIQRKPKKSLGSLTLNGNSIFSQGSDGMLLFIIGMTIGILSSTTASKSEVDNLNKQLKQTQNLVQDLHDELDMKEMLTVKDLTNENDTPPSIKEPIASPSDDVKMTKFDDKTTENPEVMSQIEAELQAELEMLERNMKPSALERISNVVELDPDFEPDIVQGDLSNGIQIDISESGNKTTDTTTNFSQPANYAVCPYELSLRLHELIETRLKERIKELETALSNNLDSQSIAFGNRSPYSKTKSSSTPQSLTCMYDEPPAENFSTNGKSVKRADKDLENEYEELSCTDFYLGKQSIDRVLYEYDSISNHSVVMDEDRSLDHLVEEISQIWDDKKSTCFTSNEDYRSEDEDSDESERLLIKQIIERRNLGTSLVLKF
ncbi:hypothetical protein ACJIZ3_020014 [Penstemon smallii]|uniref:Uncharacterized protein n=1 Tax=Penstemon smallii TaxID=265156 RepID=A0ABD3SHE1_9LAMI